MGAWERGALLCELWCSVLTAVTFVGAAAAAVTSVVGAAACGRRILARAGGRARADDGNLVAGLGARRT